MPDFTGGEKLVERLKQISERVPGRSRVSVGFMSDATYPDGTSVALVAAVNEFGAPSRGIPPRPFFRDMLAQDSPGWGDAIAKILPTQDYDAHRSMELMGAGIKGQLQQSIRDFSGTPLAPATVAVKGFDKQLVDTGHMMNSVDYEVVDGQ